MKTWQQRLRESDPGIGAMPPDAAARMRETVVRTARRSPAPTSAWPIRCALTAFACLVLLLSVIGTRRPVDVSPRAVDPVAGSERRQIQFATPGGTRIIWELNPNFTLTETLP
jgi:hypothetical protein